MQPRKFKAGVDHHAAASNWQLLLYVCILREFPCSLVLQVWLGVYVLCARMAAKTKQCNVIRRCQQLDQTIYIAKV